MPRMKRVRGVLTPFTPEEEAARDAEEAAWLAAQPERDAAKAEHDYRNDPDMPTLNEKLDALIEGGGALDDLKLRVDLVKAKHGR